MRISTVELRDYKRFTHLIIHSIPPSAKIILLIGPNGSGKTSVFDALNSWYKFTCLGQGSSDYAYYVKGYQKPRIDFYVDMRDNVSIYFSDLMRPNPKDFPAWGAYQTAIKGKFYFRTAYRNDPDFTIENLSRVGNPLESNIHFTNFLQTDKTVAINYQRIVGSTVTGVFNNTDKNKTVDQLRDEVIAKINKSLGSIFSDLILTSLGDPLQNGSFYFKKGAVENFHYKNLSAGEKSAFDIILDLIIKGEFYGGAVYCIDEPEIHMHTQLQAKLLAEMYEIIPEDGQLWISTHSLGILKKAKETNDRFPGTVAFLNFDNKNFDEPVTIAPSSVDKAIWQKFVDVALDDFSTLIAPKKVIFCEGDPKGTKNRNFDAQVYTRIFGDHFPDISFVSIGSSNDLHNADNVGILAIKQVLQNVETRIVTDRDDKSPEEVAECVASGISVLKERHLESYLLDEEIIHRLCAKYSKDIMIPQALEIKTKAIEASIVRGNPTDDIKTAAGDIYVQLKRTLDLKACGNNVEAFLRDTMAPLITPDTGVFQRLKQEVVD